MASYGKWFWWGGGVLAVAAAAVALYYGYYLKHRANVGAGYKARWVATGVFASGRSLESISQQEMFHKDLKRMEAEIDKDAGRVSTNAFGLARRGAVYYPDLGAVLIGPDGELAPHLKDFRRSACARPDQNLPWPQGNAVSPLPAGADQERLRAALEQAFNLDPDSEGFTRAVAVAYKGQLIAERYAKGFGPDMRLPGWSMSKSVLSALVGMAIEQGILNLHGPLPVPAWQKPGDPRARIELEQLLHMSSGLCFSERYGDTLSDVAVMLYGSADTAKMAYENELCHDPGEVFDYSSGTSNIISYILRRSLGDESKYLDYAHKQLFCPLGMSSPLVAPDASGTMVFSTNMMATAKDWARFGQLYLDDGVWQGRRILPKGWEEYSRQPGPATGGRYGAHWWLNRQPEGMLRKPYMRDVPQDAYFAWGFGGQFVTIVPSRQLVVVGLRFVKDGGSKVLAMQNKLVAGVMAALPE